MALADASLRQIGDPLEVFVARDTLLERPAWMRDGLCREYPEVSFFPGKGESTAEARALCRRCLVSNECLNYALGTSGRVEGIWGDTSPQERQKLRRSRIGR